MKEKIKVYTEEEKSYFIIIGKWVLFTILFFLLSVVIFKFYDIDYIWKWIIFAVVALSVPALLFSLLENEIRRNDNREENKLLVQNVIKNILIIWCYDLAYMAIFNEWFWASIILGTLSVILVFFDLINLFFSGANPLQFLVPIKLAVALCLSAYLIYIIPNADFRNIILTIIAAVYGGIFTLVGVAWTFRKSDADRIEDLKRLEEERKREERKKHIPYMKLITGKEACCEVSANIREGIDIEELSEQAQGENKHFCQITIQDFVVKNIAETSIVLKGVRFMERYYKFSDCVILEKGELCNIRTTANWAIILAKEEKRLEVIVSDILGNDYSLECKLEYSLRREGMMKITTHKGEYTGVDYRCVISNINLPVYQK